MAATRDMVLRTEGTQNVARLSVPVHLLSRANGFAMDMGRYRNRIVSANMGR